MKVNGTLINYYVHCRRQCFLHGNRLNLEDNSEEVKVGKVIHEERAEHGNAEISIENIIPSVSVRTEKIFIYLLRIQKRFIA